MGELYKIVIFRRGVVESENLEDTIHISGVKHKQYDVTHEMT